MGAPVTDSKEGPTMAVDWVADVKKYAPDADDAVLANMRMMPCWRTC